jgi:hypothetical protein
VVTEVPAGNLRRGQVLAELKQAWAQRRDNPLLSVWEMSHSRSIPSLPWYRRSPMLLLMAGLLCAGTVLVLVWFFSLHLQHWNSPLLERGFLWGSFLSALRLLTLPLATYATVLLLGRSYSVLQFCYGLLSNDPRAGIKCLDDMVSVSQLSSAEILVAALLFCLRRLAYPLLFFSLMQAILLVSPLHHALGWQSLQEQPSAAGEADWLSLAWVFCVQLVLGLAAAIFSILLAIVLGRGLSGLLANAAAGVGLVVQMGGLVYMLFWAAASSEDYMTMSELDLRQLAFSVLHPLIAMLLVCGLIYTGLGVASRSISARQILCLGFWPLLCLALFAILSARSDMRESLGIPSSASFLADILPVTSLHLGQLIQGLGFGSAWQSSACIVSQWPLTVVQFGLSVTVIAMALPVACHAVRLRRGNAI